MRYLGIHENTGWPSFEISAKAYQERKAKWCEVVGWATGDAHVKHADWRAILDYVKDSPHAYTTGKGKGWEVVCYLADGTLAFAGCIETHGEGIRIGN